MKKVIDIKGITTTSAYQDGDCMFMQNVRKKNGMLKPVSPRKISHTLLNQFNELFVHQLPSGNENWIGVITIPPGNITYPYLGAWNSGTPYVAGQTVQYESGYFLAGGNTTGDHPSDIAFWTPLTGTWTIAGSTITQPIVSGMFLCYIPDITNSSVRTDICPLTSIPTITQIGNILNILDSSGLKYIMWYQNAYVLIESNFDGDQTTYGDPAGMIDFRVNSVQNSHGTEYREFSTDNPFSYSSLTDCDSTANRKLRVAASRALIDKALSVLSRDGFLTGYFLICTAIELYDGSYILHSRPVLLNQPCDNTTRYEGITVIGVSQPVNYDSTQNGSADSAIAVFAPYVYDSNSIPEDSIKFISDNTPDNYKLYGINSTTAFKNESVFGISGGDGASVNVINSLMGYWQKVNNGGTISSRNVKLGATYNNLQIRVNQQIDPSLQPLIKCVSVFMTQQVYNWKLDDTIQNQSQFAGQAVTDASSYVVVTSIENYFPPLKTNAELIKELTSLSSFYKILEIPFEDIMVGSTTATGATIGNGLNLAPVVGDWTNIDMSDGTNGILENLVNQDEISVDNFTHHTLLPQKQMVYNSRLHAIDYKTLFSRGFPVSFFAANTGIGQFPASTVSPNPFTAYWFILVTIKTSTGISTVVRYSTVVTDNYSDLNMLSYPDSRATSMTIYENKGSGYFRKQTFKLTASTLQNYAYYIAPDLKPIPFTSFAIGTNATIPTEINREDIHRNGLKVSALDNPFTFPAANTYIAGSGIARNAASNSMRASEGQFGQYPVYILTSEKIYAMNVGNGDVVYSNITPISDETPISDILCQTPFGIVFVGKRGIFVINGQQVTFLSALIEEKTLPNSLSVAAPDFLTFIATLTTILYNKQQNELIFTNVSAYNYVLNIDSKMWYLSTEKIDYAVGNVYPELFVVDNLAIKDYSLSESPGTSISIVTRPMFFGIDEVKKMARTIFRGLFYNLNTDNSLNEPFISLYGSNDGEHFALLRGFIMPAPKQGRDYKDFDLGIMTRAAYRNYLLSIQCEIDEESEIINIESEVVKDQVNDKMR